MESAGRALSSAAMSWGLYRRVHHRFLKCVSNKRGIPTVVIDP
jgi:hypothetical protein